MEKKKKMSLGDKNNNPLNIRSNTEGVWLGQTGVNKGFAVFAKKVYGYRAALYLLLKYIRVYKLDTVKKIITRWAPPTENNTEAYVNRVCKFVTDGYIYENKKSVERGEGLKYDSEFSPNTRIETFSNLVSLIFAMTTVECGRSLNDDDRDSLIEAVAIFRTDPHFGGPLYLRQQLSDMLDKDKDV